MSGLQFVKIAPRSYLCIFVHCVGSSKRLRCGLETVAAFPAQNVPSNARGARCVCCSSVAYLLLWYHALGRD